MKTEYVRRVHVNTIEKIFEALQIEEDWCDLFKGVPEEEWEAMASCLRSFLPSRGIYDVCFELGVHAVASPFSLRPKVGDVILLFSKRTTLKELCETKTAKEAGKITFPDGWKNASIMPGMFFLRLDSKGRLTFGEECLLPILGFAAMLSAKHANATCRLVAKVLISEAVVSDGKTSAVLRMENGKITLS